MSESELQILNPIIRELVQSHERQLNRIISFFETERREIREENFRKISSENKSLDKVFKFLKSSGIVPAIASYLLNGKVSGESSNEDFRNESTVVSNDIPLIVCCKWLSYYLDTNDILQGFIKKTLRKELHEKFIILLNSSNKDFEANLKNFKEEIAETDIQDLNSIDPRLSDMEKMLLIKLLSGKQANDAE